MNEEGLGLPELDDGELAARAARGCSRSFELLVRRYQVPLLHFLKRRVPRQDAEDLLQEVFLRAYQNMARYRPRWRFTTWLFTIAFRLSVTEGQRRKPVPDSRAADAVPADDPGPEARAADREERQRLWDAAAAALSEEQHAALWLYYAETMPVREIARVLGRSVAGVKVTLFRARRKLAPILKSLET